jgi:hypothetical protein
VDVPISHPYFVAIQDMADQGIIGGYDRPDGQREFRPQNPVLRAQFAKMIDGAMGIPVTEGLTSPFTDLGADVLHDLYPHEFVAAAWAEGIIQGFSANTFGPYRDINRAQAITMVMRALRRLRPESVALAPATYRGSLGNFSEAHAENARQAEYNGLLEGLSDFGPGWNPWQAMGRGEVAHILWRAMNR